jgi:hypothetical protein
MELVCYIKGEAKNVVDLVSPDSESAEVPLKDQYFLIHPNC